MNRDVGEAPRPDELRPGMRIEDYELLTVTGGAAPSAVLGRGGFGIVYLARDVNLPERLLALKVFCTRSTGDAGGSPFNQEARLLSQLAHEAIPRVIRMVAVPGGGVGVVMEHAEGMTLLEFVRRERPDRGRPRERYLGCLLRAVGDAARGLAHMHSRGVMHYDVQPSNVLWDSAAGRGRLIDLGLATRGPEPPRGGTDGFRDPAPFDQSCPTARDVWSLGALLYYGICGYPPPPPMNDGDALPPADVEDPLRSSLVAEGSLPALTRLIERCLRNLPGARPTAAVVAAELDSIAAAALPPHNLPPLRRAWFGRHDDLATAKAILVRDRRFCVVGPGGMGKTRLVSELARDVLGQYRAAVYVDLDRDKIKPVADLAQELVLAVAGAGALAVQRGCDNGERRVLVVLDNAESRLSKAQEISDVIDTSPGWDFVVASRSALGRLASSELTLGPLKSRPTEDPAVQLLLDRLGPWAPASAQLHAERTFLQQLADALNRMPLFLELVALSAGPAGGYADWRRKMEEALTRGSPDDEIDSGVRAEFPDRQRRRIEAIIGDCAALQRGHARTLLMRLQLLTMDRVQARFWTRWVHEICNWYGDLGTREEVDSYLDYLARCGWVEREGAEHCAFNSPLILAAARRLFKESTGSEQTRTLSLGHVRGAVSIARLSWWDHPGRPRRLAPVGDDLDLLSWAKNGKWSDGRVQGMDTVDRILIALTDAYFSGYSIISKLGEQHRKERR